MTATLQGRNLASTELDSHGQGRVCAKPLVGVFDLFTGKGGVQSVMGTLLPRLTTHYDIVAFNPYRNEAYAKRLAGSNVVMDPLVSHAPLTPYVGGTSRLDRVVRLAMRSPWMLSVAWSLRRWVVQHKPDLVYFNYLPLATHFSRAIPVGSTKLVFHSHGHRSADEITEASLRQLDRRFDQVIAVSEITKHFLCEAGVREDQVEVIYNSVDLEGIRAQATSWPEDVPRYDEQTLVFSQVGAYSRKKGQHISIEAFCRLPQRHRSTLWLCGDVLAGGDRSYAQSLREMAANSDVAERIHFLGWREDVPQVLQASDVVLMPSTTDCESFGLALCEAMSLEKPVIGSTRGGVPEVIGQSEAGMIVEPNAASLVVAMEKLAEDDLLRQRMGRQGHLRVVNRFTPEIQVEKVRLLIDRVLRAK